MRPWDQETLPVLLRPASDDAQHGPTAAIPVRAATATDAAALTLILVHAIADDPLISWAVRADEQRPAAYRRLFDLFVRRLSLRQLPDWLASVGPRRAPHVFRALTTLLSKHPREPHYYLPFVGVDRGVQGQGIGSAVLQPVLGWCDTLRLGAYLENTNARNLVFYERLGFRILDVLVLAPDGPMIWPMWRSPRPRRPDPLHGSRRS